MELQRVSLTTAKLLRKRRFNEPVMDYYAPDGILTSSPDGIARSWNSPTYDTDPRHKAYAAPSLELARQWLREKKRCDVLVDREYFLGKVGKYYCKTIRLRDGATSETAKFRSFDKALEAGIQKALRTL